MLHARELLLGYLNNLGPLCQGTAAWTAFHLLTSKLLLLFPSVKGLSEKTQTDISLRVPATLHAISVCIVAGRMFLTGDLEDRIFGSSPTSDLLFKFSSSYFLWDFLTGLRYVKWFGYLDLIHHFACFFVYYSSLTPFLQYYACGFLLFEFSTIFLNGYVTLGHLNLEKSKIWTFFAGSFVATFFLTRIVFGIFLVAKLWIDVHAHSEKIHPAYLVCYPCSVILTLLNILWFRKIIAVAKKKMA
eukprot:Lithocolla_globosa_v1_NODE_6927_length_1013_cov_9.641293.p1 type:complete len:244 gc:universal NODE_6927_length_1013_cov_9.641293:857-126(-)